jgi:hypothetical protein
MQKVAEAVEKTVTAAEKNKRSVGKNGRKNTKRTMKHRNKGECKAGTHQMDAPCFNTAWHGWCLEVDADEGTEFTLSIAKNELNLDGVIEWIRRHAKGEG